MKIEIQLSVGTPTHLRAEDNGGTLPWFKSARHCLTLDEFRKMSEAEINNNIIVPMLAYLKKIAGQ